MDIAVAISVLDSTVYDVPGGRDPVSGAPIIRDRIAPQAAKFSANWLVRKAWDVGAGELSAQVDGKYVGSRFSGITNSPAVHMGSYTLWNARVGYSFGDDRMVLSAFVKNLTNEDAQVYAFDQVGFFGYNLEAYGPPRWWGVQFKY